MSGSEDEPLGETTAIPPAIEDPSGPGADASALVVGWCEDQPWRIGEVLRMPAAGSRIAHEFGRGAGAGASSPRIELVRQRPGHDVVTQPIAARALSRRHLLVRRKSGGSLAVENVGRTAMRINAVEARTADLAPGDVVELSGAIVLLCVRRPTALPALRDLPSATEHAFGSADAFGLVGESAATWRLRDAIGFVAPREGHVLVTGESGTGKELVARAIHGLSPRRDRELVARNAATLPEGLVDAELFGNAASYPNPGMKERPGLIGRADGSTLFLDEIGELPAALQAHLLRVLDQDGEYHRLGDASSRRSDLRLLAATNRAVHELKHDFLARFRLRLHVPALGDRREDIPLLVRHMLARVADTDPALRERFFSVRDPASPPVPRLDGTLITALVRRDYTLHVRELEAILWRSLGTSAGDRLTMDDELADELARAAEAATAVRPEDLDPDRVQAVLDAHGGVLEKAWRELGLKNRFALMRLVRRHGLRSGKG